MPGADTDPTLDALRRGDLAGSRSLALRAGLTEFPREILGLADTLEILDLGGNPLAELPADFGRLRNLRVLFCSKTRFARLPPALGDCPALSQVGFRDTGLTEIPAESLPRRLRWLTVTGNRLASVPAALGERPALQKLMLSGNRLRTLPDRLAGLPALELLRLSANRFEALPGWLDVLPGLAWLAWAGNPLDSDRVAADAPALPWARLSLDGMLGEGASGQVHRALWRRAPDVTQPVALKLFRGAMTSDGLPEREMEACLAAGDHPHLTGGLGRVHSHPDGVQGLAMRLLPGHWRALAGPPSLESCTRDVYAPGQRFAAAVIVRIAGAIASAGAHLQARGLSHGDLYAHNVLWDGGDGSAVLSDFGASAFLPDHDPALRALLERIDVRAWGILLGELLDRAAPGEEDAGLRQLQGACLDPAPHRRPGFAALCDRLSASYGIR